MNDKIKRAVFSYPLARVKMEQVHPSVQGKDLPLGKLIRVVHSLPLQKIRLRATVQENDSNST